MTEKSEKSIINCITDKVSQAKSWVTDHKYEIKSLAISAAVIWGSEMICYALGHESGYLKGCNHGWDLANDHTKFVLDAAKGVDDNITIVK